MEVGLQIKRVLEEKGNSISAKRAAQPFAQCVRPFILIPVFPPAVSSICSNVAPIAADQGLCERENLTGAQGRNRTCGFKKEDVRYILRKAPRPACLRGFAPGIICFFKNRVDKFSRP